MAGAGNFNFMTLVLGCFRTHHTVCSEEFLRNISRVLLGEVFVEDPAKEVVRSKPKPALTSVSRLAFWQLIPQSGHHKRPE